MTLIWKDGYQVDGWVVLHDTGAEKASHQLMVVGLDARKTDGHQTHSVKVFSWGILLMCANE